MSDILCRWLNLELRLSKFVEPGTISKDFANGYLIGEVLHRYELQEDFHQFSKSSSASSKLNNFTRLEPTLLLLGVPFGLSTAKSVMLGQHGAAARLLYQLYMVLQRKKRAGLTGTAMETMQPAAITRLNRLEQEIYAERLKTVIRRGADAKLQKIVQRYEMKGRESYNKSIMVDFMEDQRQLKMKEEMRLQQIEKRRLVRRKQLEIMSRIHTAVVHIPKPPPNRTVKALERQRQNRRQLEAKNVHLEIAQFEKNRRKLSPRSGALPLSEGTSSHVMKMPKPEEMTRANQEYIQEIRQRLEEDAVAREQREKRRLRVLMEQLQAHEAQEEALREEQLVERLTRQCHHEKKLVVQLMQVRQQKEVLRQNRIFRERQYQEQRQRDFQEALDTEEALLRQAKLEHAEEIQLEIELHKRLMVERAHSRYQKHFNICKEIINQIVDLATKAGEYRLLTGSLIPSKMMREWKELLFCGKPLYDRSSVELTSEQREKQEILNNQDYDEYMAMTGEWTWPADEDKKGPSPNNNILGHIVQRLQSIATPTKASTPPPSFPHFTIKACIVGKTFSGKTTCLSRISQAYGIHVLPATVLIEQALAVFHNGESAVEDGEKMEPPGNGDSTPKETDLVEKESLKDQESSSTPELYNLNTEITASESLKSDAKTKLSKRALHGAAIDQLLRKGRAVTDELMVDVVVDAIRQVPADSGWILDGFPVNVTQAKLLEKALSGSDPDKTDKKKQNRTTLAMDPNPPKETASPSPSLDLVVLLEVSDDLVLGRAAEQDKPEDSSCGPDEERSPIEQHSLPDKSQALHRITGFQDTWPKLEKWFSGKQNLLVKVNAEAEEEVVFRNVEAILHKTMTAAEKDSEQVAVSSPSTQIHNELSITETLIPGSVNWVYVDEPLPKEIAEYLVPYWENMCNSYVTNIKAVMQNLRDERNMIIHHLYNIREEFKQFLKQSDLKQQFVTQWQQDYNKFPDDMREDDETKAELHKRLDDLRERLWTICDQRRAEAEREQASLSENSWLENHTALLINHFSTLIQVEVDRFHDTLYLLRDYYSGMRGAVLPEMGHDFKCIPLLDTVDLEEGMKRLAKNVGKEDEEDRKKTKVIPLIPQRPSSAAVSKMTVACPSDEKLVYEIYEVAVATVNKMSLEMLQWETGNGKENVEQMEEEQKGTSGASPTTAAAGSAKKPRKKKGSVPSPVPAQSPSVPVVEDPNEVQKRLVRAKIHQECSAGRDHEDRAVKMRLELIKLRVLSTVQNLQQRASQAFKDMEEWLGARFLAEMNSIDQLTEVVRHHIESAVKIQHELMLSGTEFYVDGDMKVVATPPPSPPRPLVEVPVGSTLTIRQLEAFHAQLLKVAPTGLMSVNEFLDILKGLTSIRLGTDALPDPWMHITVAQILELTLMLAQDSVTLDWCRFLLSAALPWPVPTKKQLLKVLSRFRMVDHDQTGLISEEQYLQTELWCPTESILPIPDDPSEPIVYDRLAHLRKFFFSVFANQASSPAHLDYVNMLLYLAAHPDSVQGFVRALSLMVGHPLCYESNSLLLKSLAYMEEEESDQSDMNGNHRSSEGEGVSISALLKVVCHGGIKVTSRNQFHSNQKLEEEYEEDFRKIYEELGYGSEEKVPFSILSKHPRVQDLMESTLQYQLVDIHRVLRNQQSGFSTSFTAS
ncbi:sperm flagellar protein 2 isoform X2 [Denticeps clupeoides]|uniref:sperm flagellar protein 2 isoform X2 n=1 Tax=Denticeps clupeoides TaxID=299321 RepID=UPI0010A43BB5|nr:sperm flagellar protein 2 isoform X2 [Denticeps clupeoides]